MNDESGMKKVLRDIRTVGFVLIGFYIVVFPAWIMFSHGHVRGIPFLVCWGVWSLATGVGLIFGRRWGCILVYLPVMAFTIYILCMTVRLFFISKGSDLIDRIVSVAIIDVISVLLAVVMNLAIRKYWSKLKW